MAEERMTVGMRAFSGAVRLWFGYRVGVLRWRNGWSRHDVRLWKSRDCDHVVCLHYTYDNDLR